MAKTKRRRGKERFASRLTPKLQREVDRRAAFQVLTLMRTKGKSLTAAIKQAQTTKTVVVRYVGSALIKAPNRRYRARPSDRFARRLQHLTPDGPIPITVRGSRAASRQAEHSAAVSHYLNTGDASRLDQFRGESVRARKLKLPFLTDPKVITRLQNAGLIEFEHLYASTI